MSHASQIPADLLNQHQPLVFLLWLVTLPGDYEHARLTMQHYESLTSHHFNRPHHSAIRVHYGRRDGT